MRHLARALLASWVLTLSCVHNNQAPRTEGRTERPQAQAPSIDWASMIELASANQAMEKYIDQARATYPEARRRFLEGLPEGSSFFVTVRVHDPTGHAEELSVRVDQIQSGTIAGRFDGNSKRVKGYSWGQDYTCPEREIVDWLITHPIVGADGNYLGKFWTSAFKSVPESDIDAMTPYVDRAHADYPEAKRRFLSGLSEGGRFFVKVWLFDPEGHMELVTVAVDEIRSGKVFGRIQSDIHLVEGHSRGEVYSFPERDLIDWSLSSTDGNEGDYVGRFRASAAELGSPWLAMTRYIIEWARDTYPEAKRRFLERLPEGSSFMVAVRLQDAAGHQEDLWIAVDEIRDDSIYGRVSRNTVQVKGYSQGQAYPFPERMVVDWSIKKPDGSEEGNYAARYPLTDLVGE